MMFRLLLSLALVLTSASAALDLESNDDVHVGDEATHCAAENGRVSSEAAGDHILLQIANVAGSVRKAQAGKAQNDLSATGSSRWFFPWWGSKVTDSPTTTMSPPSPSPLQQPCKKSTEAQGRRGEVRPSNTPPHHSHRHKPHESSHGHGRGRQDRESATEEGASKVKKQSATDRRTRREAQQRSEQHDQANHEGASRGTKVNEKERAAHPGKKKKGHQSAMSSSANKDTKATSKDSSALPECSVTDGSAKSSSYPCRCGPTQCTTAKPYCFADDAFNNCDAEPVFMLKP